MRSNYKKIGDYIQRVSERNSDGTINLLLGVNLDKKFIPSVANINGVDLTKYKVIKKGQFGCKLMSVGRDKKLPISRLTKYNEAIISSAYFVFEVLDEKILLPEYLMMWFSRDESDRYLWFQSGGDVRGRITWEDLCSLPIKVPLLAKQQEIVNEYNTVVNKIKLNKQLNKKLEETAQSLYKHWFVDLEFPNEQCKPYKSSGGEMVYNEGLDKDIPIGWSVEKVAHFIEIKYGKDYKNLSEGNIPLYGSGGIMKYVNDILYDKPSILIPRKGSLDNILLIDEPFWSVDTMFYSKIKKEHCRYYIYHFLCGIDFYALNHGAAVPSTTAELLNNLQLNKPENNLLEIFNSRIEILFKRVRENKKQSQILQELQGLLLSKMTKVEIEKEKVS
jgi:type I restriction enzyme S subunit